MTHAMQLEESDRVRRFDQLRPSVYPRYRCFHESDAVPTLHISSRMINLVAPSGRNPRLPFVTGNILRAVLIYDTVSQHLPSSYDPQPLSCVRKHHVLPPPP